MSVTLTIEEARQIRDALDVSVDNIELDCLNDTEGEFDELLDQVKAAVDVIVTAISKTPEHRERR